MKIVKMREKVAVKKIQRAWKRYKGNRAPSPVNKGVYLEELNNDTEQIIEESNQELDNSLDNSSTFIEKNEVFVMSEEESKEGIIDDTKSQGLQLINEDNKEVITILEESPNKNESSLRYANFCPLEISNKVGNSIDHLEEFKETVKYKEEEVDDIQLWNSDNIEETPKNKSKDDLFENLEVLNLS